MDGENLVERVNIKLHKAVMNPQCCLAPFKVGNEEYRSTSQYSDPRNYPAYYYIGTQLKPKKILDLGFDSGFQSGCLLKGCRTVEHFLGFHQRTDDYWSVRLACANIANILGRKIEHWEGDLDDLEFIRLFAAHKWDCVLLNKPNREWVSMVWSQLNTDGVILIDSINSSDDYAVICQVHNRKPLVVRSRFGIGLLIK